MAAPGDTGDVHGAVQGVAPWILGGSEGRYEDLTMEDAQEQVAGMKDCYPQIESRIVKAVTTYEYVVLV